MTEILLGTANVLIYFAAAVIIVFSIRKGTRIYDELFRKLLHFVLLGSLLVWTFSFPTWWRLLITVFGFVVIVYPILLFFERFRTYSDVVTERKKGELKNSLIVVFSMFIVVVSVCEGIFHDRYLVLASVFAWGIGDAFAALVGKKFGRHKIRGRFLSGKKSLEGTLTMLVCAFLSVFTVLYIRGGVPIGALLLVSFVTAAVSSVCELYTKDGMDTVTCPLASMATILLLLWPFGGLL